MRRFSVLSLVVAILAGGAGCILKKIEYDTVLNTGSKIVEEGEPVTVALAVLTLAVALCSVIIALKIFGRGEARGVYSVGNTGTVLSFVGTAFVAIGAVILYMENKNGLTPLIVIFTVLALFAGAGIGVSARYSGERANGASKVMCVMPSVFCCMWLVIVYRTYSAEPQLIKYVYRCLSLAAITMAYYYSSGFFYDRNRPKTALAVNIIALYLSIVILGDNIALWEKLIIVGLAIGAAVNVTCLPGCFRCSKDEEVPDQDL